jgi:hypothetical protein
MYVERDHLKMYFYNVFIQLIVFKKTGKRPSKKQLQKFKCIFVQIKHSHKEGDSFKKSKNWFVYIYFQALPAVF